MILRSRLDQSGKKDKEKFAWVNLNSWRGESENEIRLSPCSIEAQKRPLGGAVTMV